MNENNDIVGKIIQGYKILKPIGNLLIIGQGKFSTVFKAESSEGVITALKKIKVFR